MRLISRKRVRSASALKSFSMWYLFFTISINSHLHASPFKQNCVAPDTIHFSNSLVPADFAKSAALMQREAANIFGKYSGLQGPDSILLRFIYKCLEQLAPDTQSSIRKCDIHANLGHAGVSAALPHRTE